MSTTGVLVMGADGALGGPYYPSRVPEGIYEIRPAWNGRPPSQQPPFWVGINPPSTALGARAVLAWWSTHSSLRWRLREESVFHGAIIGGELVRAYRITNLHSNKCLDIKGPARANFTAVHQWVCKGHASDTDDPDASQLWKVTRDNAGTAQLINAYAHRCLDIPEFRATPGRFMQIWSCSEAWNQPSG